MSEYSEDDDVDTESAEEIDKEMCEHMRTLVLFCRTNTVYFGGCGECGSAWLECKICDKTVYLAHHVFDPYHGGQL